MGAAFDHVVQPLLAGEAAEGQHVLSGLLHQNRSSRASLFEISVAVMDHFRSSPVLEQPRSF